MSDRRNIRRQYLARHLHAAGPRPVLEALLDVENGRDLDEVLADFARVAIDTYRAVGADEFPISQFQLLKGGCK